MKAYVTPLLLGLAQAQSEKISTDFSEWPKYKSTDIDIIPKGSTSDNSEGYWLDGTYSTVTD